MVYTLLGVYIVIFSWFSYINISPHVKVKTFERKIDKAYCYLTDIGEKYVFKNDSLVFWSDNTIPIRYKDAANQQSLVHLQNGYYLKKTHKTNDSLTVWLYNVKADYINNNKYTLNRYNPAFQIDRKIKISHTPTDKPIKIDNKVAFYLDTSAYNYEPERWQVFVLDMMLIVGIFLILMMFIEQIDFPRKKKGLSLFIIILLYVCNGLLVFHLCSYSTSISFRLYTKDIQYDNILIFSIITACSYLVFTINSKLIAQSKNKRFSLTKKILILLLTSTLYGSIMQIFVYLDTNKYVEEKAKDISVRRNMNAEEHFVQKIGGLENDSIFLSLINNNKFSEAENYVDNIYFKEAADSYHIGTIVFTDNDSMLVQPMGYYVNILNYVEGRIDGARRIDSAFVWVEDNESDNNTFIYLCKNGNVNVFLEFLKKKNSKNMNYSLLLEPNDTYLENQISYARYHKGNLVYSVGQREFPNFKSSSFSGWKTEKNYRSYYLQNGNNTYIVCYSYEWPYNVLGAVSLFFLLFIAIFGLEHLLRQPLYKITTPGIRSSILLSLIGSFVIGIAISGFFNIRSIHAFNTRYNAEMLKEKTGSIKIEMEKIFANNNEDLDNTLLNLSNTFLTDINIYDTNAALYATSQKTIFEEGFLLDKINMNILSDLDKSMSTVYKKEKLGELSYQSSYCPIRDGAGKTLYYLNIPFINQQKILNESINNTINNFINMFLFWINISIVLFIFISDFITKPLQILKERLKKVDIDAGNERIEWKQEDEIGELIKSYNLMIDKIEESSYLLKQQERNSSWRELAKQVAHDINNPLTPMKLSLQYLQKLYEEKPELFESKFKELAPSLISQIDSISTIASELNNYSKPMSQSGKETELISCIKDAINIFENSTNMKISFDLPQNPVMVMGNKTLFLRIFNNILKNAYQAVNNRNNARIDIVTKTDTPYFVVSIKDNGCGIKDKDKDKIFTPHFTTKADGNGIGLSIVKNIIENYEGTINFLSKENEGTVFNIGFKLWTNR